MSQCTATDLGAVNHQLVRSFVRLFARSRWFHTASSGSDGEKACHRHLGKICGSRFRWAGLVFVLTCLYVPELLPYTALFLLSNRPARIYTQQDVFPLTVADLLPHDTHTHSDDIV